MPYLQLFTNVSRSSIQPDLPVKLAETLSKNLEKPIERIRVHVVPEQILFFGSNSDEPCAVVTLCSIGKVNLEINEKNSRDIMAILTQELGIPPQRQNIVFEDLKPENVGVNGKTVASK